MSVKELLAGLNDRQRQAVETTRGPVLVLAGPGSGKTKVVTSRIAYLLEQGAAPEEILAITFTRKAAREMSERVAVLLGGSVPKGLTICNFHSLGLRFLRDNHQLAGLPRRFDIVEERQQLEILKHIAADIPENETTLDAAELRRRISFAKNLGLSPADVCEADVSYTQQVVAYAYQQYEQYLRDKGIVDLDDLILRPLRDVFDADELTRRAYKRRYKYIMVDEYQDTNSPQFELIKHLVSGKRNLCVVGDDDQSIYGFRGSNVDHILNFADDFPGTRLITLETNYRSSRQIVDLANQVIEGAEKRYPKKLQSHHGDDIDISRHTAADEDGELHFISKTIRQIVEDGEKHEDIAILFRGHDYANSVRQHLKAEEIPVARPKHPGVHLLTLHSSKGLEFPSVILPAVEEGAIPQYYAVQEGTVEEERRLFYVGLTRARRRLCISSAHRRRNRSAEASRFLRGVV